MVLYQLGEYLCEKCSFHFDLVGALLNSGSSPGTAKSEVLQGQYAKLVLPAATYDYVDVVVTYVESWTTVHVQLANAYRMLQKLQKQLQQTYHTTNSLPNPVSGSAGIIKYDLQNECNRVLIIKRIDPTLILVRFVDFGYTDVAAKQLIHPISKNLTDLPGSFNDT
ncbi:hypothetical protein LOAG_01710 [Loa loa]|uniref:Tudor domain-containing protein n=1 Tax=Loa loa TaxID=7209 RepID=A0A1S0U8C4_LOALO|nr:hypothetical protein LOAG_01710 [Loa loa]EFO26779.1 hypothetical protein LOAG_01710 [Loa loa]